MKFGFFTRGPLFVILLLAGCGGEPTSSSTLTADDPSVLGVGANGRSAGGDPFNQLATPDATSGVEEEDVEEVTDGYVMEPDVQLDSPDTEEVPEPQKEVCDDGVDNDLDGKTDCADPECAPLPSCTETVCGDGIDNDGDGTIDCSDPNCFGSPACEVETCENFYSCLAEQGCGCTFGTTCPETGTPEFEECQQNCLADESGACTKGCVEKMSPKVQNDLASFQTCTANQCSGLSSNEAYYGCVIEECLQEYAACFYNGVLDCGDFYYKCANDCDGDLACIEACRTALSQEGFIDAVHWDVCRDGLCDLNDDGELDSDSCYYLGSFFACADEAGSCIPENLLLGNGNCVSTTDCLLSCSTFAESSCVLSCLEMIGDENKESVSAMVGCIVKTCGSTDSKLTPLCAATALANSCQNEWAVCSQQGSND